jgi:hypothetical protein
MVAGQAPQMILWKVPAGRRETDAHISLRWLTQPASSLVEAFESPPGWVEEQRPQLAGRVLEERVV